MKFLQYVSILIFPHRIVEEIVILYPFVKGFKVPIPQVD